MSKRYRKMAKKANGKIRDEQVLLELPLPVADVLAGIPDVEEELSQKGGLMLIGAVIESECKRIAGQKNIKNPLRTTNWWGSQLSPVYYNSQKVLIDRFLGNPHHYWAGQKVEQWRYGSEVGCSSALTGREEIQTCEGL